ncbi:alpha/beta hydrolase [Nocardia salmonicida]|uniref:alpha/beta hydrolase n=1 Tax=Nocardia salmonicida TaxID=53431 RepID=UPI00362532DB
MSTESPDRGLDDVAADQRALIRAFRDNGSASFDTLGVDAARAAYTAGCARNGLLRVELARVEDMNIGAEQDLPIRLYSNYPAGSARSVLLFAHGGGWVMGSPDTHDTLCRYLAAHADVAVVSVDYRLAPEHPYPAAVDDMRTATRWLMEHGVEHGLDVERVIVGGDSAGGQLAAAIAAECPRVRAQMLLYPVLSLAMDTASYHRVQQGFPLTAATMHWFTDLYLGGIAAPRDARDLNPGLHPHPIPTFLSTVGNDPLCDEGIDYAATLAACGAPITHIHLPRHAHGLFTSAGVVATGRAVLDQACVFLAAIAHEEVDRGFAPTGEPEGAQR